MSGNLNPRLNNIQEESKLQYIETFLSNRKIKNLPALNDMIATASEMGHSALQYINIIKRSLGSNKNYMRSQVTRKSQAIYQETANLLCQ